MAKTRSSCRSVESINSKRHHTPGNAQRTAFTVAHKECHQTSRNQGTGERLHLVVQHHDHTTDAGLEDPREGAVQHRGAQLPRNVPLVIGEGANPICCIGIAGEERVLADALHEVVKCCSPTMRHKKVNGSATEQADKGCLRVFGERQHNVLHYEVHVPHAGSRGRDREQACNSNPTRVLSRMKRSKWFQRLSRAPAASP